MADPIEIEMIVDDEATKGVQQFSKNAIKSFGKVSNSMKKKLGGAFKSLAKHTGKAIKQMAKLGMVGAAAMAGIGAAVAKYAIGKFAGFETAMANVSTLVDTSKVSMDKLKKGIMDLPAVLGSATDNAKALYQALSAGIKPANAIKFVGEAAKAAKAGLTDTFTAVDAGTTILNAFGKETKDAKQVFDQMFKTVEKGKTTFGALSSTIGKLSPIASAASVTIVEMFASIAALTKGGFATSEAVSRMATALGSIIKPAKEASDISAELGLDFSAAALKAKGLAGFLDSVKTATGGNIETMAKLFGGMESLSVMLALTGKQAKDFKEILGEIKDSSGAVDKAFQKQISTLTALWETFKNTIGKQAIMLGAELVPSIKIVMKNITAWIGENQKLIRQRIHEFAEKFAKAIKWATDNWKSFSPVLSAGLTIIKGIGSAFNAVGKAIGTAIGALSIFVEKFNKSKVGKFVTKAFIQKSPPVPWSQGIKEMTADVQGLGKEIRASLDLGGISALVGQMRQTQAKLALGEWIGEKGATSRAVGRDIARSREVYQLQLQLLRNQVKQYNARAIGAQTVNINLAESTSGAENVRNLTMAVRRELDRFQQRGV